MIVTVASYKGGVGKTTTAVHLAACLAQRAPTVLLDADEDSNALDWASAGKLPFPVYGPADQPEGEQYAHTVIDTQGGLAGQGLELLAQGCDLLVIPTVPGTLDSNSLLRTVLALQSLPRAAFRVLLVRVPPPPETEGANVRAFLDAQGVPMFAAEIPRLKAYDKAAAQGVLVRDVADRSARRAWEAYEAAAKELT